MAALKKIGRSGGALRGRGPAIAGLIASVCTLLVWVLAAGIGGGVYFYDRTRMEESRRSYEVNQIRTLLSEVEAALNRYQDDIGHPPTIDEGGLRALLRKPQDQQVESKWKGPYLRRSPEEMPLDPWGHRLNYEPPPSSAGTPYRLWSSGPDGISGTPDDLSFESGESEMAPVSAPGR
jgi:general secretion pathway protein G